MLRTADKRLFVGNALSGTMAPTVNAGFAPGPLMTPASSEFATGDALVAMGSAYVLTGTWQTANKPLAISFFMGSDFTIYQLGWLNGSGTMTDSVDVGVYDFAWNRKISTTGTARSGASALQFVDVTDTPLPAGHYYMAMVGNGTTANQQACWTAVPAGTLTPLEHDSATSAYPLPNPLTNMVNPGATHTSTGYPVMVIALRSTV